jgi:phosphoribosylanthranilate isomerase
MEYIKKIYEEGIVSVIQLHGDEDEAYTEALRGFVAGAEIWKAFKVRSENDVIRAGKCAADRIVLDNGYGTGERFDWSLVKEFDKKRLIIAGGLNAGNIRAAIERFDPYAADMSSGVESRGVKDRGKISAAVAAARGK